ncbi:uncharacterized protein PG986_003676 [Apiospora aurea]|uniref:Uncharacterized protein n=1 Tax=Apiospora aurea TaxID=335848 RepID=A0ABR1QSD4_9PEZI
MCRYCHLGYPGHTLYCPHFHPPFRACPLGSEFKFVIAEPEQCFLAPDHAQIESAGFQYVDIYDENSMIVGQRPCARFVPAGTATDAGTSQLPLQQGAFFEPIPTIPEVESDPEAQYRFVDQTQRVDAALVNYRTSHPSVAGRGRGLQRPDLVSGSEHGSRSSSQVAAAVITKRSSSMPAEAERSDPMEEEEDSDAVELSYADPVKAASTPGGGRSPTVASPKGNDKEVVVQPPSSLPDIGSHAPVTPASKKEGAATKQSPVNETPKEQQGEGSAAAASQDVTPTSPALSSDTNTTTTAPSTETKTPSVRRLPLTEESEFPSLQAIAGPSTPSGAQPERPVVRSWASLLGPKKHPVPPLSTLKPHEATPSKPHEATPSKPPAEKTPPKPQPQPKQKKQEASVGKDKSPGAVTIGRSYATEPAKRPQPKAETVQVPISPPTADDNPPLPGTSSTAAAAASASTTRPVLSYSAALASGSNSSKRPAVMPAKPTKKGKNSDWAAPPRRGDESNNQWRLVEGFGDVPRLFYWSSLLHGLCR